MSDGEHAAEPSTADSIPRPSPEDWSVSDVKTTSRGRPIKRSTPPEHWEAVGRRALADLLQHRLDHLELEVQEAIGSIEYGAPVHLDHITRLREAVENLEVVLEHDLVPLVDGPQPWERTADRVPARLLYYALGLDDHDVEQLRSEERESESA